MKRKLFVILTLAAVIMAGTMAATRNRPAA